MLKWMQSRTVGRHPYTRMRTDTLAPYIKRPSFFLVILAHSWTSLQTVPGPHLSVPRPLHQQLPPLLLKHSLAGFTNGATETGCIKLGGRLWGRATFPAAPELTARKDNRKLIWSHIWLHLFHTCFTLQSSYALPSLLSNSQLRRIQKMRGEGANPRKKGLKISLGQLNTRKKYLNNYTK